MLAIGLAGAPAAAADTGDVLSYYGGPVAHSMNGIVVDWGSTVNHIYTDEQNGDPGLIKYLAASSGSPASIGGVLAQYMDSTGANAAPQVTYGRQYQITPSVNPTTILDWQIQRELVSQIDGGVTAGGLPRPAGDGLSTIYLVLFPAGHTECLDRSTCSGQAFCAYHGNAQLSDGTPVLYAVLPDNTSGAMNQDCGSARSALANQTSYASHEWSEAITDPLVAEANPGPAAAPLAWYDDNCPTESSLCGEVGDKCNAEQAQAGGWTVQLEWSNLERICESTEPSYSTPTASFSAGAGAVVGQAVSFDGSSSSDPGSNTTSIDGTNYAIPSGVASYSWDWGDGSATGPQAGAKATHTFTGLGVYQVSLTVTDNLGFKSTVTRAVEVASAHPSVPTVTTGSASNIGAQSATLSGTIDTGGQPVSYRFAYGTTPDALAQSTPATHLGPGTGPVPVSAVASGLIPSTTYYYRLDVTASGQPYSGDVASFTTAAGGTQSSGSGSGSGSGSQGGTPAPSALQLPSAATGGVNRVSSSGASVTGSVDPNGVQTSYHVEFGISKAYGHSSLPASAGAGSSSVPVAAVLAGLRPRTVYHYRVVATSAAGTAVGADRTFRTRAAPARAPRFSFAAPRRMTTSQALAGMVRVRFRCSAACTARFTATIALPGIKRVQAIPATLARGSGRTARPGYGQARLTFTRAARSTLRRARSVELVISGYAVRGNSAPSAPRTARLTLTRR